MSDYTPSTDEVRDIYTWDRCVKHGRDDSLDTRTFREDFDRWLASVEAAAEQRGAEKERERIAQAIKDERENVPTLVLATKGQQAAWKIGLARAFTIARGETHE